MILENSDMVDFQQGVLDLVNKLNTFNLPSKKSYILLNGQPGEDMWADTINKSNIRLFNFLLYFERFSKKQMS